MEGMIKNGKKGRKNKRNKGKKERGNYVKGIGKGYMKGNRCKLTRSLHFSQKYALSPSRISPMTNCSSESSRRWFFTVTGSEWKASSLSYLEQEQRLDKTGVPVLLRLKGIWRLIGHVNQDYLWLHSLQIFWSANIPQNVFLKSWLCPFCWNKKINHIHYLSFTINTTLPTTAHYSPSPHITHCLSLFIANHRHDFASLPITAIIHHHFPLFTITIPPSLLITAHHFPSPHSLPITAHYHNHFLLFTIPPSLPISAHHHHHFPLPQPLPITAHLLPLDVHLADQLDYRRTQMHPAKKWDSVNNNSLCHLER